MNRAKRMEMFFPRHIFFLFAVKKAIMQRREELIKEHRSGEWKTNARAKETSSSGVVIVTSFLCYIFSCFKHLHVYLKRRKYRDFMCAWEDLVAFSISIFLVSLCVLFPCAVSATSPCMIVYLCLMNIRDTNVFSPIVPNKRIKNNSTEHNNNNQ